MVDKHIEYVARGYKFDLVANLIDGCESANMRLSTNSL